MGELDAASRGPRIGAVFQPSFAPERLISAARAADAAGVPELWIWEDCFREAAFAQAAVALASTERLRLGIGVAPMPLRNVALTAMEIATLERIYPGRLIPGLGHGVQSWMGQVGARVASPLTLMREYLPALRSLLAGDEVTASGRYVSLDHVQLDWPLSTAVPVFAAAEGEKTLALSGAVADGTLLPAGWSPDRLRGAVARVQAGRAEADLGGRSEIVAFVITAFGGDEATARMEAELDDWKFTGDQRVAAIGDIASVSDVVAEFSEAGADAVILQPTANEPDLEGFMRHVGEVAANFAAEG